MDDVATRQAKRLCVIASGQQHSVKDFIIWTANEIGIELSFQGEGENEIGVAAQAFLVEMRQQLVKVM